MALLTNINNKFSVSDAGAVTFNNAFTFPTADGTANYVLKTNGSGQLAWAADNNNGDITGSGTANTVTKFTGAKVIGNGPITFSSNDSTFAGSVEIRSGNKLILQRPNNGVATEISTDSTGAMILNSINDEGFFFNNAGTNAFKLDPINATFAGTLTATNYFSSSTGANIFLGSVITKPGDNLGFIVRNSSNTIIGSFLRTSNTTSKLTTDNLALGGTTAQYVRGDGSFATFSPGTGTVTGSGSASRVAFWTTTSNISYNDDFKYDGFRKIALGGDIENSLSDFCSIELGNTGMIMSEKADSQYNALFLSNNAYYTDAWRYKTASVVGANYISLYQGKILFATAPAPTTAGDAITWSTKMTLLNNGNFGIGTDSPPSDHRLQIHNAGAAYSRFALTNSSTGVASGDGLIFQMETLNSIIKNQENGSLAFGTNGRETDLYINSSGSINIGSRRAALPSNFGYSSSYKVLILGSSEQIIKQMR